MSRQTAFTNAGTITDDSLDIPVGLVAWTSPSNATSNDGSYATVALDGTMDGTSDGLYFSNFAFSGLTSEAIIEGIEVRIDRKDSGIDGIVDEYLHLVWSDGTNSAITRGADKASATSWPASDGTEDYGGVSDTWSEAPTTDEVLGSDFGFVLFATVDGTGDGTAFVDHGSMRINYHFAYVTTISGGASGGGSATQTFYDVVEVGGGSIAGGSAAVTSSASLSGDGGALGGGFAFNCVDFVSSINLLSNPSFECGLDHWNIDFGNWRTDYDTVQHENVSVTPDSGTTGAEYFYHDEIDISGYDVGTKFTISFYSQDAISSGSRLSAMLTTHIFGDFTALGANQSVAPNGGGAGVFTQFSGALSKISLDETGAGVWCDIFDIGGGGNSQSLYMDNFQLVVTVHAFNASINGGSLAGGTSLVSQTWTETPIGGSLAGGSAAVSSNFAMSVSGGGILGGIADIPQEFDEVGSGGAIVAGAAIVTSSDVIEVGGGILAGGVGFISGSLEIFGSGGGLLGGAAHVPDFFNEVGSGGAIAAGAAANDSVINALVGGGLLAGGVADVLSFYWPQGGALISGASDVFQSFTMQGGVLASGAAVAVIATEQIPVGGAILGGLANVNKFQGPRSWVSTGAPSVDTGGGASNEGITDAKYNAIGGVILDNRLDLTLVNSRFDIATKFLWRIRSIAFNDLTFLWSTGELGIFFYRVIGKARDGSECNLKADPCCQKYILNVQARSLPELCEKLSARKFILPIESVQRFTRPASLGNIIDDFEAQQKLVDDFDEENGNCNALEEVNVCDIPQCADFCVDFDLTVDFYLDISRIQINGNLEFESGEGLSANRSVFVSGEAEVSNTKNLFAGFYEAVPADWKADNAAIAYSNHYIGDGGAIFSIVAETEFTNWQFTGGEWPRHSGLPTGTTSLSQNNLEGQNNPSAVAWQVTENALTEDGVFAQVDVSFLKESEYLIVRGFDLNLPSDANIFGFNVWINLLSTQVGVRDVSIVLVKGDTIISDNIPLNFDWPLISTTRIYGSSGIADLQVPFSSENVWDVDDLNGSDFGVAFRVKDVSNIGTSIAFVDSIKVEATWEFKNKDNLKTGGISGITSSAWHYESSGGVVVDGDVSPVKTTLIWTARGLGVGQPTGLVMGGGYSIGLSYTSDSFHYEWEDNGTVNPANIFYDSDWPENGENESLSTLLGGPAVAASSWTNPERAILADASSISSPSYAIVDLKTVDLVSEFLVVRGWPFDLDDHMKVVGLRVVVANRFAQNSPISGFFSTDETSSVDDGVDTVSNYDVLDHIPIVAGTLSGTIFDGAVAVQTFSIDSVGAFTLSPIGSPAVRVTTGALDPNTGTLILVWDGNPGPNHVVVEYEYSYLETDIKDSHLYLVNGDTIRSDNLADTSLKWPNVPISLFYGSNGLDELTPFRDLDADPLTPDEINNPNFGVAIAVSNFDGTGNAFAKIDGIAIELTIEAFGRTLVAITEPKVGGSADAVPQFVDFIGGGGLVAIGGAEVKPFWETMQGGLVFNVDPPDPLQALLDGPIVTAIYTHDVLGGIGVGGLAEVPEGVFSFTSSGGVFTGGTARQAKNAWEYVSDGNIVFISGSADATPGSLSTPVEKFFFDMVVLQTNASFAEDEDLQDVEGLSDTVTQCGCTALPLVVEFGHNLVRDNIFAKFLARNGFPISDTLLLRYNTTNDSWQTNLHFDGWSPDADTKEKWDLIFELQCTNNMGGINIGMNIWKVAVEIFRRNLTTFEDFDTRIIVGILPEDLCDVNANELDFEVNYNTLLNAADVNPLATIYQNTIYDNIGLFKNPSWTFDPELILTVSQSGVKEDQERVDLTDAVFV